MNTTLLKRPLSVSPTRTLSPVDQATQQVADSLVELCTAGSGTDAIRKLYADNARHIEAQEMPGCPRIVEGKAALLERSEKFEKTTTIHSHTCGKPTVNGDQFTCEMSMDCTSSEGPGAGERMEMSETCLYTVKDGQITEGKFFYDASVE